MSQDRPIRIDLAGDTSRQVIVDREPGQYLGHVSTLLLEDRRTILAVYPKGHGRGAIAFKRSPDAGKTWSARLPVPQNWETSLETPTIHRVIDPKSGKKRLIVWSGLYPARLAVSEDDGRTWSPLRAAGDWGGIVVMGSVERLKNGDYAAWFHDDGRFFANSGKAGRTFTLYQTLSHDGGLHWDFPKAIWSGSDLNLCEPGVIRSPKGGQIAMLLRENLRTGRSYLITSDDEAKSWSAPKPLSWDLTGDRHTLRYATDGRLVAVFRSMADDPWKGDFVAWVGRYEDLVAGNPGQFRVRLLDNQDSWDCGYPGLERVFDGALVATTYGHWAKGEEPYIVSVRFRLQDLTGKDR